MWVKLSPKHWEEIGNSLRDTCNLWEEFVKAGGQQRWDNRKSKRYERIYRQFLTAPIKGRVKRGKTK